jgi:hypothetical protein
MCISNHNLVERRERGEGDKGEGEGERGEGGKERDESEPLELFAKRDFTYS